MLCHEMWSSSVRTHHYARVPKAWKNPCHFIFRKRCPLMFIFNAHTWCNGTSFKFKPLTIFSNFIRLAMLKWPCLWCHSVAPSFKDFATFAFSFQTLTLRRYKFFSLRASATTIPWALFTLQPSLSNFTMKPLEMSLLTEMRLFFILGT